MPPKKCKNRQASEDGLEKVSMLSICSDDSDVESNGTDTFDDSSASVLEKVCMAIDGLSEKRPENRINAIRSLQKAFRIHYLYLDDTWNYNETFLSGLESSLKRGKPVEQVLAAECLAIFCAQLSPFENRLIVGRFQSYLEARIIDTHASCAFRGMCASTISWAVFMGNVDDFTGIKKLMNSLESVFKLACLKGDGKAPVHSPGVFAMLCDCLRAWTLLYTTLPTNEATAIGQSLLPTVVSLLQSTCLDIRLATGDVLAIIFERIRYEVNENFKGNEYAHIVDLLIQLANHSTKSTSKLDQKRQRHSFRDLLAFIKAGIMPSEQIVKLRSEQLIIDSYCQSFYYDLFCQLLSMGMNTHLQDNLLMRTILGLGPPLPKVDVTHIQKTQDKASRHYANQFAFKVRTQKMGSSRDKRNVVPGEEDDMECGVAQ